MERRKFFKSMGLLSLAAVMPKFLFGSKDESKLHDIKVKEDKTVIWSDSKVAFVPKNYTLVGINDKEENWQKEEYRYACLISNDVLTGEVKLYVTNNVDSPKVYVLDKASGDFKFHSDFLNSNNKFEIIKPEPPFVGRIRFAGTKLTDEQLDSFKTSL